MKPKLIILMGLPGSGKSAYAKDYLIDHIDDSIWCSSDNIRKELYGDESIQGNPAEVFSTLHDRAANYLRRGYTVLYDATNVNRKSRKSIINIAKHLDRPVHIHGVVVWAPIEECIERDSNRSRTVGVDVIDKFVRRWQSPYYDEGFDSIEIIRNTDVNLNDYRSNLKASMDVEHENPHHSLGILAHCLEGARLVDTKSSDTTLNTIMKWHDCGKPYTKFFKPDNPLVAHYYDHQSVGGYLSYGLDWPGADDAILGSWAITNHMEPFFSSAYYKNLNRQLRDIIDLIHECDLGAH